MLNPYPLRDNTEQFAFEYVFSLLVLLTGLVCLVILPAHTLVALFAMDIPHHVSPCGHVPLSCFTSPCIDYLVEEVGFTMLAAEVARNDIVMGGEMCLAVLTAEDLGCIQVDIVGETHGEVQLLSGSVVVGRLFAA